MVITSKVQQCFGMEYGNRGNLHKNLFFAVFWLKLDLEAVGGDLTRVLPVLQVLWFLFFSIG